MSEALFVQGDRKPDMTAILHEEGNPSNIIDLTNCTVRFQMRKPDDKRYTVNMVAEIVDATGGSVRYQWATNDLSVPGEYHVQWEITLPDGKPWTTANPRLITVRRQ
jgi:hypothetical protein